MPLEHVKLESIMIKGQPSAHGVTYLCPSCDHVLGVSIDPEAWKADLVEAIVTQLRRKG